VRTSIVIRALNEAVHLPRLFDGLERQSQPVDEIVLVDSGSTDDTVRIAESHGASIVHIPPGDFTFGGSLNIGCERAKGDVLIFASAHVYPQSDHWIERLVAPFEDAQVGLSYGGQDGDEHSNFAEVQLLKDWFPDKNDLDQKHPFCNNANCAVRRELWERHPYDEELTGLEDIHFGRKVLADGFRIAYIADARIVHVHDEHFRQTLNRYKREAMAYQEIFGRSDMDMRRAARLFAENLTGDLRTAHGDGVLRQAALASARFRLAQFAGAYLGHREPTGHSAEVVRRMYYPRPK
jgi:glycosyltransferase involved in cell wall biosynthesis